MKSYIWSLIQIHSHYETTVVLIISGLFIICRQMENTACIFYILHCKYESMQWIIFSKRCHILGSYFKQMVEICNLKWLQKINDLNIKDNVFIWWLYDSFNLWNLAFKAVSQKSNHTFISTHLPVKQLESVFFIRCFYEISSHITQQNEHKLNKLHQMVDN